MKNFYCLFFDHKAKIEKKECNWGVFSDICHHLQVKIKCSRCDHVLSLKYYDLKTNNLVYSVK